VGDAGVPADHDARRRDQCRQVAEVQTAGEHPVSRQSGRLGDPRGQRPFGMHPGDEHVVTRVGKAAGHLGESIRRPTPPWIGGTGVHDGRAGDDRRAGRRQQVEVRRIGRYP
jgi:hypothetical protein